MELRELRRNICPSPVGGEMRRSGIPTEAEEAWRGVSRSTGVAEQPAGDGGGAKATVGGLALKLAGI
ncbi:unnamed protein product [Heligmosomoides polygyrus]|uniref:Uncharacterized protein n=1 Tax=Heligmosomoides polygyrus TaxID=6339 RepID=A0A183FID2_HELPZ|nr:unnamed protein product [Heligmosomoides polygyrus]